MHQWDFSTNIQSLAYTLLYAGQYLPSLIKSAVEHIVVKEGLADWMESRKKAEDANLTTEGWSHI